MRDEAPVAGWLTIRSAALRDPVSRTRRLWRAVFHPADRDLAEWGGRHANPLVVLVGTSSAVGPELATNRERIAVGIQRVGLVLGEAHELDERCGIVPQQELPIVHCAVVAQPDLGRITQWEDSCARGPCSAQYHVLVQKS